jgi:hypothetical protein
LPQNHATFSLSVGPVTYRYLETPSSWTDAQATCAAIGTGWNLGTISSEAENTAVTNWAPKNVWIGLNNVASQSTWAWSSGMLVSYTSWGFGEPNNLGSERGTYLKVAAEDSFYKGQWDNVVMSTQIRTLCSVSALALRVLP